MTTDDRATQDQLNALKRLKEAGAEPSVRTFDEVEAYDETLPADGERTMIAFTVGERGALTSKHARIAAKSYRKTAAKYPQAYIYLQLAGYDTDWREIWEIEETRDFYRRFARFAGLTHSADAQRSPLEPISIGVLAKCGAFKDVDPDHVPVAGEGKPN